MKRRTHNKLSAFVVLIVCLIISAIGATEALAAAEAPGTRQPGASPGRRINRREERQQTQTKLLAQQTLISKEWVLYLRPGEGRRHTMPMTDLFTFTERKVTSRNLSGKGFSTSNYAINIQDEGVAVWETMQVNEKGDRAFLRGEIRNDVMTGVISMRTGKDQRTVYHFTSVMPELNP